MKDVSRVSLFDVDHFSFLILKFTMKHLTFVSIRRLSVIRSIKEYYECSLPFGSSEGERDEGGQKKKGGVPLLSSVSCS